MPQKWLRSNVCTWRDEMPKMTYEGWTRLFLLHLFNISVTFYSIFNPCPLPAIISPIFALELEVAPFLFFFLPCSSVYNRLPSSFLLFFHPLYFCSFKFAAVLQRLTCSWHARTHNVCMFTCIYMHSTRRDAASCSVSRAVLHHEEKEGGSQVNGGENRKKKSWMTE